MGLRKPPFNFPLRIKPSHTPFSTTTSTTTTCIPQPELSAPSATEIANIVLTTQNPTHLRTLLTTQSIPWSEPLVNQIIKYLWNHAPKALQFFNILTRHPTYSLSLSSFHLALDLSARLRDFPTSYLLLSRLRSLRMGPTPLTFSLLLERLISAGKPDRAIKLFLSMPEYGCPHELNSFNTLLDILCKSKRVEKADNLFKLFRGRFKPDVVSFNILASGWCLVKRTNKALDVFRDMIDKGITPSLNSYNIILKGYFRAGQTREAWDFFREMKRRGVEVDVVTYTTLIHGFGVIGEVKRARRLFDQMAEDGVLPNVATYNALIQVLCKKDCADNAAQLYEEMVRRGYAPNSVTYNLLIRGFCHRGEMHRAEDFVDLMRKDGCGPNVQTYNLLIRYYCEAGDIDKGLDVFDRMDAGECLPNVDTYNVLISSMFVRRKSEDLMVAGKMLVEMVDRGFLPTRFNFNRVLNGLLVTGNQEFAREILRLQGRCGILPGKFRL